MKFDFEFKNSKFESFYQFLKSDGLVPVKSERLHKKKIYSNLLNEDQMTIDNFQDFLELDRKEEIKKLVGKYINFDDLKSLINDITFVDSKSFKVHTTERIIVIKFEDSDMFINKHIVGDDACG